MLVVVVFEMERWSLSSSSVSSTATKGRAASSLFTGEEDDVVLLPIEVECLSSAITLSLARSLPASASVQLLGDIGFS